VPATIAGVVVPVPPLATGKVPVTPVVKGKPVAFVSVPEVGVPRIGVTKVGLVESTLFPEPVLVVTPVPPLSTGSAVPDRVIASVPVVVMGLPATDKNAGTEAATEVTVPEPVARAAIAAVVVRTVAPVCTTGTISVPVRAAEAARLDIEVLAMFYPWSRKSPFSSIKKSISFDSKIPVVTPPPPPPLGFVIVDNPVPNPKAILVNPKHAGCGSTRSPNTNDLHGDYLPSRDSHKHCIVTLSGGHFNVTGNTHVNNAWRRQVRCVAVGERGSPARKHRERGAVVGLFTHINLQL